MATAEIIKKHTMSTTKMRGGTLTYRPKIHINQTIKLNTKTKTKHFKIKINNA